jgi:hypothetical protein
MITLPRPTRQVVPRPTREVVPRHRACRTRDQIMVCLDGGEGNQSSKADQAFHIELTPAQLAYSIRHQGGYQRSFEGAGSHGIDMFHCVRTDPTQVSGKLLWRCRSTQLLGPTVWGARIERASRGRSPRYGPAGLLGG